MAAGTDVKLTVLIFLIFSTITGISGEERHLTVLINAGEFVCFHETFQKNIMVEVEYQVVKGGDLDISFYLAGPQPTGVIASTYKEMDGYHDFDVEVEGEYQLCLDNTFSTFSEKVVYFEVFWESEDDMFKEYFKDEDPTGDVASSMAFMREVSENIRANLTKVLSDQTYLKMREVRHKHTADANNFRVNFFSMLYLVVMVAVSIMQIYVLKRLFRERRKDKIRT